MSVSEASLAPSTQSGLPLAQVVDGESGQSFGSAGISSGQSGYYEYPEDPSMSAHRLMRYVKGERCMNGVERMVNVSVSCGLENKVAFPSELLSKFLPWLFWFPVNSGEPAAAAWCVAHGLVCFCR